MAIGGYSMTLSTQKGFSELVISIEHKLVKLGWATATRSGDRFTVHVTEPRVLKYAIASCVHHGLSSEFINRVLAKTPPEKHWYRLRTLLPESALYLLEGKLDGFLLSDEH
jgi:hypothetical protein